MYVCVLYQLYISISHYTTALMLVIHILRISQNSYREPVFLSIPLCHAMNHDAMDHGPPDLSYLCSQCRLPSCQVQQGHEWDEVHGGEKTAGLHEAVGKHMENYGNQEKNDAFFWVRVLHCVDIFCRNCRDMCFLDFSCFFLAGD